MMKVAMKIAYNGANFCGFQKQKDRQSVSGFLEEVFGSVGIFEKIIGSGRTDKGVHASAQVISLKIPDFHKDLQKLQEILNLKLYPLVKIKRIWQVDDDFHARFDAKRRGYCYVISQEYSPFIAPFAHYYCFQNVGIIKEALKEFEGLHNFKAFMKNDGSGAKGSVREIYKARLLKRGKFYIFLFWGNGFLRSQIRLMVGYLLEIDKGNLQISDLKKQLLGERIFSIPAPPNGLFLSSVKY